jgi:uncharacterized membrane protein
MFDAQHEQELIDLINQQIAAELAKKPPTFAEKTADLIAKISGGWYFMFFLIGFLCVWVYINVFDNQLKFDPFPFILLNLFLSFLSIFQNVIIGMTQNRISSIDRTRDERGYMISIKSDMEIKELHDKIDNLMKKIYNMDVKRLN